MTRYLVVLGLALLACGGSDLKAEGEECVASSECREGLTCDFGASPPVCRPMQTPQPDASPAPTIDASPNAPDADPSAPDAAPGTPDAMPTPDAAVPDAAVPDAGTPDA